jgi:2-amino-4-hydroxy-6-hydroxymethyldihydropteridine diphosphokinase
LTTCYLALGSNLGDREDHLSRAREELAARGARILRESSVRETEPFGVTEQPRFLNQVLEVDWAGSPRELLEAAKEVEEAVGRTPTYRWGPREIDIDILLFGDLVVDEPGLTIPHPGLAHRSFVQLPLAELRPDILAS